MQTSSASARSSVPARIVVDANAIFSALISERSAASRIFWSSAIGEFATTAFTITEVQKYLPELAEKTGRSAELLQMDLRLLPLVIYQRESCQGQLVEARKRIGERDLGDVDLLALALRLRVPVWSNDNDFEVAGVVWYTTTELAHMLEVGGKQSTDTSPTTP